MGRKDEEEKLGPSLLSKKDSLGGHFPAPGFYRAGWKL